MPPAPSPAPAPAAAPEYRTARVQLAGEQSPRLVVFNLARLEAVEEAMGKSSISVVLEDLQELVTAASAGKGADPTPEQVSAMLRSLRVGFIRRFLAGCLDVPVDSVDLLVPASGVLGAMVPLVVPFVVSVMELLGGAAEAEQEGKPADPPEAGQASAG